MNANDDRALASVVVALGGVWMVGGAWWPLGMVLAVAGVGGAVAGLTIDLVKDRTND